MQEPIERELGKVLTEISGLNFNTDSNSLLAISDNERNIFEISLRIEKLRDYMVNLKTTVFPLKIMKPLSGWIHRIAMNINFLMPST